jgi:hypothetical protein
MFASCRDRAATACWVSLSRAHDYGNGLRGGGRFVYGLIV